ncbi:MAG: FMN-binding protein [Clostridia bacterium]|nr:FMN-binding protein [Clostridia bacterium]
MSKTKRRVWIIVCVILLLATGIGLKFLMAVQDYKSTISEIDIKSINLEEVEDGRYIGYYDASFVKAEVSVDIKDHRITDITLLQHVNGRGGPAEAIIPEVIKSQSLQVDAVSGATSSSKVILKAIEIAIQGE